MKSRLTSFGTTLLLLMGVSSASAHFGMIIPSDTMVMQGEARVIRLQLSFSHPFEAKGLPLERPQAFGVMAHGQKRDLLHTLKQTRLLGQKAWSSEFSITRPGVYTFYMQPRPYWEPAEEVYIIHYTKSVVAAFGNEEGWDRPLGVKTEIVPLTRPFGLYAGNVFQGIVLLDRKPVPFAPVEVTYYNQSGRARAPTAYFVTQVIKADQNGLFTYAVPVAGWWGFAALNTSEKKMKHGGEEKDVELGAVLWVEFHRWP